MGGGLESRCVGRVYGVDCVDSVDGVDGADCAVRQHKYKHYTSFTK